MVFLFWLGFLFVSFWVGFFVVVCGFLFVYGFSIVWGGVFFVWLVFGALFCFFVGLGI